jgi:hypothetical protein
MDDRLQEIFGVVVPGDRQIQFKVTDDKNPDNPGPLAKFLASQKFPASYRVFLVNSSNSDISKIEMETGGFEGIVQLNVVSKKLGPLGRGQTLLLETLNFEMLDFGLWYNFDILFSDGVELKAGFTISKAHSLKQGLFRTCAALGTGAYHFPLQSLS